MCRTGGLWLWMVCAGVVCGYGWSVQGLSLAMDGLCRGGLWLWMVCAGVVSGYGWSVQGWSLACPYDLRNGSHAASGLPKWKTVAWGLTLRGTGHSNSDDWSSTTANTKGERVIHEWSLTVNSAPNWDLDFVASLGWESSGMTEINDVETKRNWKRGHFTDSMAVFMQQKL